MIEPSIEAFLVAYPGMGYGPLINGTQYLSGLFQFNAKSTQFPDVTDEFILSIAICTPLEKELPEVFEEGGRIPRITANHVNPDDSLCLGSPLRQRLAMRGEATLRAFAESCIVPFLYASVLRERGLDYFPFGELEHGAAGLAQDYQEIFKLDDAAQLKPLLRLLTMEPERADRQVCPCCGFRAFGACLSGIRARMIAQDFSQQELTTAYSQLFDE